MSDTLTRGPEGEATSIDQAARIDKVMGGLEEAQAADAAALPQADQAPDPTAPAVETTQDVADLAKMEAPQEVAPNPSAHVLDLNSVNPEAGTLDQAPAEVRQAAVEATTPSTSTVIEEQKGAQVEALREKIAAHPGDEAVADAAHAQYQAERRETLESQKLDQPKGGSLISRIKNMFGGGEK